MESEQGEFLSSVAGFFALSYPWVVLVACDVPGGVRQRTEPQSVMSEGLGGTLWGTEFFLSLLHPTLLT